MPRKRIQSEPVVYEGDYTLGNIVVIESPDNVIGSRAAIVLDKQKWCKDGIPVMLVDPKEPVRYLCIRTEFGDAIRKTARKSNEE